MNDILLSDYKSLFESAPGLYLVLQPDLTIVAVSDAYLKATMTQRNQITGHALFEIFPDNPDDKTATGVSNLQASLSYVLQHRMPHTMAVQKYDIRRPDGSFEVRYWSPLNKPILDENGDIRYIIHRVEDVTEFVRLQEEGNRQTAQSEQLKQRAQQMEMEIYLRAREIQETNKKLVAEMDERKRVEKELEAFTYSVSHDLKAPARTVHTYADMLIKRFPEKLTGQPLQMVESIDRNSIKMSRLIDNLLNFSRASRQDVEKAMVDMTKLADSVVKDLSEVTPNHAKVSIRPLPVVYADQSLIHQVLTNLIGNAIKYSSKKEAPEVNIDAHKENGDIVFCIRDNGVGFDMKFAGKLFTPFQRLHTDSEYEGSGLGLSIVHDIIIRHGGKVWVESKAGKGTTVFFTLPAESAVN